MNFELSDDQKMLKDMVREFVQKEIEPNTKNLEEKHAFPSEILKKLAGLGLLGMTIPAEYEGSKTDFLSLILALEEISYSSPSIAVIVGVHSSLFSLSISKFGTKKQKEKYLPRAAKGEIIGAFALTEPEAGSDATNLKAKAVRDGDFYILNGTKAWVTTGADSEAFITFALVEVEPGVKKLSSFIVETDFPGVQISKIEEKMGLHSSPTAEIVMEDCQVPIENLLGEKGKGAHIAFHCLDSSRIGIGAQSVGISQRALEEAARYAKQRQAFGKKISEFQAIQFAIADMSMLIEAARLLTYKAADLNDRGKPFTKEASMAKLFASEAANKVAYQALQIHGGYGYSREFLIEQIYRDVRVLPIYEGTSEIQRMVISRHLLKDQ